jgi:membrane-bound lytic murein transglycosylase D
MKNTLIISSLLLLTSCSTFDGIRMKEGRKLNNQNNPDLTEIKTNPGNFNGDDNISNQRPVFRSSSDLEISEIEKSQLDEVIPETSNKSLIEKPIVTSTNAFRESLDLRYSAKLYKWWINFFTKREKARFNRHLNNGIKYKALIKSIFKEHGLPSDLYYVGLIESGYNTYVRSRAGATGPWQFMRGTARDYGLRVDNAVDERANLVKATHAAARYFKDLYNIFASWELVLCAYNAGENRVIGAIRRGNTRDYRELVKKRKLPKETIYYIPKVAAAKTIIDAPEQFGFKVNYNAVNPYVDHKIKNVSYSFDVRKLASGLNIPYKQFKTLNPDIRHRNIRVRSKKRGFDILVPSGTKTSLAEAKTVGEFKYRAVTKSSNKAGSKRGLYRVRRGDNLTTIARRLGVSVKSLKQINNIRGSKILVGQKLKTQKIKTRTSAVHKKTTSKRVGKTITHKVRRGENLTSIARKYGTSVRGLRSLNNFRRKVLFVGQRIRVPASSIDYYTVRRGDNLSKIASKFGISLGKLKALNNFRGSRIFVGQKVRVPSKG